MTPKPDPIELVAQLFDRDWYLQHNADVSGAGLDPFAHYCQFGWRESRDPVSWFSVADYLAANEDVAQSGVEPFGHYLSHLDEGELPEIPSNILSRTDSGHVVFVSHDLETGGAQRLLFSFMRWLRQSTFHEPLLISLRGGREAARISTEFRTLNLDGGSGKHVDDLVAEFIPDDTRVLFLSTAVSASLLPSLPAHLPVVAYVHEMAKVLDEHRDAVAQLAIRRVPVIAGSEPVRRDLIERGIDKELIDVHEAFVGSGEPAIHPATDSVWRDGADSVRRDGAMRIVGCGVCHWRKWPEAMIELADAVRTLDPNTKLDFVWIGDGPTMAECQKLCTRRGLDDRVRFVGHVDDAETLIATADFFLLSSVEDPFPLVGLAALRDGLPVLAFQGTGGVADLVEHNDLGVVCELGDFEAMAAGLCELVGDEHLRSTIADRAETIVSQRYTLPRAAAVLWSKVRGAAHLLPYLSVVVPNYNYEHYIDERLDSIADQTFGDYELIILDDCSTDGSPRRIEGWLANYHGCLTRSETNSGSPFTQWFAGLDRAASSRIWIAEADDVALPTFLEEVLAPFVDPNVGLSYCNSDVIDDSGEIVGDHAPYLRDIHETRSQESHVGSDYEEVSHGLGVANTIPNVSALVFEKPPLSPSHRADIASFKLAGDWAFYLLTALNREVAYTAHKLNLHRRHQATVTHTQEGDRRYLAEVATAQALADRLYSLPPETLARAKVHLANECRRFGIDGTELDLLPLAALDDVETLPALCIVCPDLSPGGGQVWAVRLANRWVERGGRVALFNVANQVAHFEVLATLHPRVRLFGPRLLRGRSFPQFVTNGGYQVMHSAIWWADRFVLSYRDELADQPWVVTMHGCHESILDQPDIDFDFDEHFANMVKSVDQWISTADKNERVFRLLGGPEELARVVNGVPEPSEFGKTRDELGIPDGVTVVLIASRAIESKGWRPLADAVFALNAAGGDYFLVAIGDGPLADELGALHGDRDDCAFVGQVRNLAQWIAAADICCLPSTFAGESLPLVVLEFMAQAKPVVATNVGSIGDLLGGQGSGELLLDSTKDLVPQLKRAIASLADPARREAEGRRVRKTFEQRYTMDEMVDAYLGLYRKAIVGA